MTTAAYDFITVASTSGQGPDWSISNLTTSTTNLSTCTVGSSNTYGKTLSVSIPDYMADIELGSEFVSMAVQYKAYVDTVLNGRYTFRARQNGATTYEADRYVTSTGYQTPSGDATFWGFTGTGQAILSQLRTGAILFRFEPWTPSGEANVFTVKNFQVQLVYAIPDTKRASILTAIP